MPSLFAAEVLDATAACDEVMAEAVHVLTPMATTSNTGPAGPDPSRQSVVFMATFRDPEAKPLIPDGYDPRTFQRPGTQSSHPRVQVTPAQMAMLPLPLVIKNGDLLTRAADGKIWQVSSSSVSTSGILRAPVNLVG